MPHGLLGACSGLAVYPGHSSEWPRSDTNRWMLQENDGQHQTQLPWLKGSSDGLYFFILDFKKARTIIIMFVQNWWLQNQGITTYSHGRWHWACPAVELFLQHALSMGPRFKLQLPESVTWYLASLQRMTVTVPKYLDMVPRCLKVIASMVRKFVGTPAWLPQAPRIMLTATQTGGDTTAAKDVSTNRGTPK